MNFCRFVIKAPSYNFQGKFQYLNNKHLINSNIIFTLITLTKVILYFIKGKRAFSRILA